MGHEFVGEIVECGRGRARPDSGRPGAQPVHHQLRPLLFLPRGSERPLRCGPALRLGRRTEKVFTAPRPSTCGSAGRGHAGRDPRGDLGRRGAAAGRRDPRPASTARAGGDIRARGRLRGARLRPGGVDGRRRCPRARGANAVCRRYDPRATGPRARLGGPSDRPCDRTDPVETLREATEGRGADAVLEAVGSPQATGWPSTGPSRRRDLGRRSAQRAQFSFSPVEAYDKNLTYRIGRCPVRSLLDGADPAVRSGRYDLASIISHRLPLERAASKATRCSTSKTDGCTKVVLHP